MGRLRRLVQDLLQVIFGAVQNLMSKDRFINVSFMKPQVNIITLILWWKR